MEFVIVLYVFVMFIAIVTAFSIESKRLRIILLMGVLMSGVILYGSVELSDNSGSEINQSEKN